MNIKSTALTMLACGVILLACDSLAKAQPPTQTPPPPAAETEGGNAKQAELEKKFTELFTNARLVGRYTMTDDLEEEPAADMYEIKSVTKLDDGDKWRFDARIKFGEFDVTVPIVIPVEWAGETPVITVDGLSIPSMGTYSARVVIHGDKYAASWDGGGHGGFMWGTIEKIDADADQ